MAQLHLYMNNPTAGQTNGTEISTGTNLAPLTFTLDATQNESAVAKLAVRCDEGYVIEGNTSVYIGGDSTATTSYWKVAADNNYADSEDAMENISTNDWLDSLTLSGVADTNKIFWVKCSSASSETPKQDRSVKICAEGLVVAAS